MLGKFRERSHQSITVRIDVEPEKPGSNLLNQNEFPSRNINRDAILLEYTYNPMHFEWSTYNERFWRAIVTGRFKYGVYGGTKKGGTPWLLFDLENDPDELDNLINEPNYQNVAKECHQKLRQLLFDSDDFFVLAPAYEQSGFNYWQEHEHMVT
ncbi:MAG: sulfatase/phosphatase domain-containing protein [Verrucomicrobiota bacterium]